MKQYEKLFVPEKKEGVFAFRDNQGDIPVPIHGQFILTTIEELREVFDAGYDLGSDDADISEGRRLTGKKAPTFTQFIEQKGIKLNPNG